MNKALLVFVVVLTIGVLMNAVVTSEIFSGALGTTGIVMYVPLFILNFLSLNMVRWGYRKNELWRKYRFEFFVALLLLFSVMPIITINIISSIYQFGKIGEALAFPIGFFAILSIFFRVFKEFFISFPKEIAIVSTIVLVGIIFFLNQTILPDIRHGRLEMKCRAPYYNGSYIKAINAGAIDAEYQKCIHDGLFGVNSESPEIEIK